MTLSIVLAGTVLLAAAGAWRWRPAGSGARGFQVLRLGPLLAALFCILLLVADATAYVQSDYWSFIRLAPSIAQSRGTPLYAPDGKGPLLGWSYGPVMPLVVLPLGLLSDPSVALIGAALMNTFILLLPLLLSIWRAMPPTPEHRITGVLILGSLHALLMHCVPSLYWLRKLQVDTYAMGLGLLGIVVLLGAKSGRSVDAARLWGAAALFVAAVFSKHNEVVLALIPCGYLWLRDGRLPALRMALAMAVLGAAALFLCVLAWGWEAVFLNLWLVPARHPWAAPGTLGLTLASELFLDAAKGAVLVFLGMAGCDGWIGSTGGGARPWLADRPWMLPASAAVLIFPVSLVGRIKVGGDDNSFHSVYFLAAAAGMIAARWVSEARPAALRRLVPVAATLITVVGTALYDRGQQPLDLQFRDSRLRREYRFACDHRGEVWFGANPLVTLYSDGRAYHQGYGVFDRTLPNLPPTPRHLEEYLPPRLRWVSTPPPPFWRPEGLIPMATPEGLQGLLWFERRSRH
ncbi:MAG TPA: hypothetical protein VG457_11930 [Planctomycetota bacterium]|jgi:hypothetical protein|nr:hypothetical protein [Planctomycetota bacterium]